MHTTSTAAVIVLAAGGGTRMRSSIPKVLHEIGGRSLVSHVLRAARAANPAQLVAVIGHGADQVGPHIEALDGECSLVIQHEQRGTGHAVLVALEALPDLAGTVVVLAGDTPLLAAETLTQLVRGHEAAGNVVTILTGLLADPTGYGRIIRAANGTVERIVEQPDATPEELHVREFNSGIYAFDAAVLREALARVRPDNHQGELYLTDVVGIARGEGGQVGAVTITDTWQTEGCNDRAQLAGLGAELNRRTLTAWMREGVTIVDPATTWVDVDVRLATDVTLLPGVQLHGATVVDAGATVGPDSTLRNVVVHAGATVIRTHGSDAVIGPNATVGPFAYVRPGTTLGAAGKIGTFVETKNAHIADGAKVPHLSYVGDADIGAGTNIGAGTIFANYDGVDKHRTTIGAHASTGADNVFVAPVEIGDGAATGAGTVVRRNVPPGTLAVSTGAQRHIDDWVKRRWPDSAAARAAEAAQASAQTAEPSAEESST